MASKTDKPVSVTPEVKQETPKVVVSEIQPVSDGPELSEKTKAEMAAGREALAAYNNR